MSGRSTPSLTAQQLKDQKRHSRNPSHLSALKKVQINGRSSENVFASLRATTLAGSKPFLPAELIATILDFLPVPDLLRFARVSRRLQEMVYDDTRWIQKLNAMKAWNEAEARQRMEEAMKRKTESQWTKQTDEAKRTGVTQAGSVNGIAGGGRKHAASTMLFDAGVEEQKRNKRISDGFSELAISSPPPDTSSALTVFKKVKSIRGHARQEFGKIYSALGPVYFDLAASKGHSDALIFRTYRDPEQQAQILANLRRFALCDISTGWEAREERLDSMIGVFENAVLQEFTQGCAAGDVDGRMHRYAHVLVTLNGGIGAVDSFISNHPIMTKTERMGNPLDCLEDVAPGHVDLNPSQAFFERLASVMVEQADVIDRVFPQSVDVLTPFWTRLCEDLIAEYLTPLFDEAHAKGNGSYVKAVAGTFGQALRLHASLRPTKASPKDFADRSKQALVQCFEKHVDLYLAEEFELFRSRADADVNQWEKELSEQEASTESFFMSNINRQAAKRDFLSSFKKVVMMPVNAFPISSPFAAAKPAAGASASGSNALEVQSNTPPSRSLTPQQEAPTDELAAKAAIMNSKLEGIKSLFSIEVALNLTHLAKASIERAALMVQMGGHEGQEAQRHCRKIFVTMLEILGNRHIKNGFDKAVTHLGTYNPREVRKFKETARTGETSDAATNAHVGVEPLVTFLELVNVGDLIQQMIDVFYSQELVAPKLLDRDDFLDAAVKEKKKFEQMLDERVAAGLNKGIDVLMDEVEYICATSQMPSDFNPTSQLDDIGPSTTAKQVVDVVSGHTGMLVGSTDKNMLDVFNQEVGLRLFAVLCKHFKRQRISVDGAIRLISDINHYSAFVATLRQKQLAPYFESLRELSQIYLVYIDPPAAYFGRGATPSRNSVAALKAAPAKRESWLSGKATPTSLQAKELATIIADSQRYHGIITTEEVYEFAERRADWYLVKGDVERAMYGVGCVVM
jgi:recyclin-1